MHEHHAWAHYLRNVAARSSQGHCSLPSPLACLRLGKPTLPERPANEPVRRPEAAAVAHFVVFLRLPIYIFQPERFGSDIKYSHFSKCAHSRLGRTYYVSSKQQDHVALGIRCDRSSTFGADRAITDGRRDGNPALGRMVLCNNWNERQEETIAARNRA
jgi:hypothetical protein